MRRRRRRYGQGPLSRWLAALLLALALLQGLVPGVIAAGSGPAAVLGTATQPWPESSEILASRSLWSRPESYPLEQTPRADLYRPSADWIGRLILPTPQETAAPGAPAGDWVWIEMEQAPEAQQALLGRRLRLQWAERPELQRLVASITTTIQLGQAAQAAAAEGNVVPTRLDGRRVGPLQSLAGARPNDDVVVALDDVALEKLDLEAVTQQQPTVRIARPPLQISGRWQGLVQIVAPGPGADLWRVIHYNKASAHFDGAQETIRIPSLPSDRYGRRLLDPAGLLASPLNAQGWLIQGAPAADGVFTVQALLPHELLQLPVSRVVSGTDHALADLRQHTWAAPLRRGSVQRTALIPTGQKAPRWAPGERALLLHLFGGIGGVDGEPVSGWTVTGHFAFGEGEVVRDTFTGQPRLALHYLQIYANNPNGIVAGRQDWSAYGGNLQRGWIGLRPFADALLPMGAEVLEAIELQAELIAARYRSGDGSGVALVTPSTSCVQDSAQALWISIQQLRQDAASRQLSDAQQRQLHQLGMAFDRLLEPFGRVRGDWYRNASTTLRTLGIAAAPGPQTGDPFQASQSLSDVLLSWRSLLPRSAHDLFAEEFLRLGIPMLLLRTNQIPGADPALEPVAPTALLGQLPAANTLLSRLGDSLFPRWRPEGQLAALAVAGIYGALALTLARRLGWQHGWWHGWWRGGLPGRILAAAWLFVVPAFTEELLFRALLLPSPHGGLSPLAMLPWMALSVGLFVAWLGLTRHRHDQRRLREARFVQVGLLGVACTMVFWLSGSLWWAATLHWLAALAWREPLAPESQPS